MILSTAARLTSFIRPHRKEPILYQIETRFAKENIEHLVAMEEGWDGYGSLRIPQKIADNAIAAIEKIFLRISRLPDIVPNSNGTITLEWETPDGEANLEVGITRFSFLVQATNGKPIVREGIATNIPDWVGELIAEVVFPLPNTASPARTATTR